MYHEFHQRLLEVATPRFAACNSEQVGTDSNFPGFIIDSIYGFMVVKTTSENSDISESCVSIIHQTIK